MNYYNEIREQFINNKIYKQVKDYSKNRNDLETYYNVGKLLIEAQGGESKARYGDNLIKEYSVRLTEELGKGYTVSSLKRMRQFYSMIQKGAALRHQLTWTHYRELLKLKNINEINYYIDISIKQNLSYRELNNKIKDKEYERLPNDTKDKLILNKETKVTDFIKNPIIIKTNNKIEITEKILKQLILENIDDFLNELGEDFCYRGNEYKIKIGDRYNYIDLLLFNIKYNCYVVVELKVTELKAEHIGQISKYINYADKNIKTVNQNGTIGIIIFRKDNEFIMEYCSDSRIFQTTYKVDIN